jgi:hypothetical protein
VNWDDIIVSFTVWYYYLLRTYIIIMVVSCKYFHIYEFFKIKSTGCCGTTSSLYWKLKEEALDRTLWRTRFGKGYDPVVKTDYGTKEP